MTDASRLTPTSRPAQPGGDRPGWEHDGPGSGYDGPGREYDRSGPAPVRELLPGVPVALGGPRGLRVTRTLPNRVRRMVGAWCFVDHIGPQHLTGRPGMRVAPHPHTGLQTVTWLVAGEVLHRDSLGNHQLIRPGEVNLMTAGLGISHSEETPARHSPSLHGVQLWTALPDRYRHTDPHFAHHADLPVLRDAGTTVTVVMGEFAGVTSPARTYSPLVGAEVTLDDASGTHLPLVPDFEYAVLTLSGTVVVDNVPLTPGPLLHLGTGRSRLPVRADRAGRILLLGGEPFDERIVMWWNFVGRDHDEIVADRTDWMSGRRFGTVHGYDGDPLPAPPMPTTRLMPRGRHR
ncbi:pirin family protein [Planosporangium sp. 12N6]|uniref:pirin family protein n=1 Tax=Planosporangium spinosum TaxID=3402278 RepID=UPI003CF32B97